MRIPTETEYYTHPNVIKGLCRAKHDMTAACWQRKVEQVYIKSKFGHSILFDTENCWTW